MRVFVDTNVMVDLECSRADFLKEAEIIFDLGYRKRIDIGICALSFINTYYIGRRYKLAHKDLAQSLADIASFVTVSPLDSSVINDALLNYWNDFEDSAQFYSARSFKADVIVSRNVRDFADSNIPVVTPHEFLLQFSLLR